MSITHRRLVRTEGQCPPNLSGPTSETTGTGSGVGGLVSCKAFAAGRGSCHLKGKALCIGFQTCAP
ncbi:hypothetical protein TanjilG_14032 [Lupinus angustifolius]|uniref:Uncharacterized protein n=1 Tax=Lupinus angustifolius TaxID=3871 RepID=A0A1J7FPP2_LUPAN|nr:hypothetical protein TanjilG_14032 [Lupinus angustifolius]